MRSPNFNNILKVLKREVPERPILFEFIINHGHIMTLAGKEFENLPDELNYHRVQIQAFKNAGYDFVTLQGSDFEFPANEQHKAQSISLNEGAVISDRQSFIEYPWPDPDKFDYSRLDRLSADLPEGMKIIVWSRGGVLENTIKLVGYENLCFMIYEEPELVEDIFNAVGSRLLRYYENCAGYDTVGALISNDDWGFNTQTMLSPDLLRQYVFPWHKRIAEVAHSAGKPAILHSCGNLELVMEDIIEDMKFDGKHSYEDGILPVEEAYKRWGDRIAILGGLDINFLCQASPEEISKRSRNMLEISREKGGYALGTGNSVPDYVPLENYYAMIKTVEEL